MRKFIIVGLILIVTLAYSDTIKLDIKANWAIRVAHPSLNIIVNGAEWYMWTHYQDKHHYTPRLSLEPADKTVIIWIKNYVAHQSITLLIEKVEYTIDLTAIPTSIEEDKSFNNLTDYLKNKYSNMKLKATQYALEIMLIANKINTEL